MEKVQLENGLIRMEISFLNLLAGCRIKKIVALGPGNNGAYWECNFTEVKVNQIKGFMVFRDNEGQTLQGDYMIKRISDILLESQFKTKDPKDGQLKAWKGTFKKVVKKK